MITLAKRCSKLGLASGVIPVPGPTTSERVSVHTHPNTNTQVNVDDII